MKARLIKKADIESRDAQKRDGAIRVARIINVADWVREKERRSDVAGASVRENLSRLFRRPRTANG